MRHRLSPSKLGLAERCTYWANPSFAYDDEPPGRAARVGSLTHRMSEMVATGNRIPDMGHVENDLHEVADALAIVNGPLRGWLEEWRSVDVPKAAELSLRMNVETGHVRPYPRRGEPGYELPRMNEIGGEIDLVRNFGTYLEVVDLKTGDPKYFTESQLRGYGVLAANYYGVFEVRVGFLRALKTKLTPTPLVTLDVDELDDEHGRIRRTLRMLPESQPQPGDWCWACPAKRACPARAGHGQATERDLEQAGFFESSELAF